MIRSANALVLALGAGMLVLPCTAADTQFDERGLTVLTAASGAPFHFTKDEFSVTLDGHVYESSALAPPTRHAELGRTTFHYTAHYTGGSFGIAVVYESQPEWNFVSKRIVIAPGPSKFHIDAITPLRATLAEAVHDAYVVHSAHPELGLGDYGGFLHFPQARGLLALVQNPFLRFSHQANSFAITYQPDMDWNMAWGAFSADPAVLAPYHLSGVRQAAQMIPEWTLARGQAADGLDRAEVDAFTDVVRAFLMYKPARPLNLMVGWCVNDYQIDVATPQGRAEYKRIIDMASELGARYLLFAPANSDVSRREDSTDDWGWEFTLWLGLGQKIRRNEWNPADGLIPASVEELRDYARMSGVQLVAYVYPVLGFTQNREWLTGPGGNRANLGVHAFQDWLTGALESFYRHAEIGGFSFDHTFLHFDGASRYAQWWGWRRVMETLRKDIPAIAIDGRQAYQLYGPWSWLAGSYPHPTSNDEQPESFVSFPDLHFDRVSADRERYTAYRYRNYEFAPSEVVPGYMTHQTPRNDDFGHMPEARTPRGQALLPFRRRDWDYLGWRYSLLSSIAVGGWNNVINMIPARDPEEFANFSSSDKQWFRHWIDWTNENREYLRHTHTILGQPAIGKVDGTCAIIGNRGYIFLFNPNGRRMSADLTLDQSIGLDAPGQYQLRELYPLAGRLVWAPANHVSIELDGGSAAVFAVEPQENRVRGPVLFNAPGKAALADGRLAITGLRGEIGSRETLTILLPDTAAVRFVTVNGKAVAFERHSGHSLTVPVTFAGDLFHHYQQIGSYDPTFTGGTLRASFRIPRRIFDQLVARRKAWPISWNAEEYRTTWLAPHRLLLYVQIAEPDDNGNAALRIDGRPVDLLKAYASVRAVPRNFVGFYADVSLLEADRAYTVELDLPQGLKPGQFQGLFFENVETEYTAGIRASGANTPRASVK